jgi:NAD(P)-dependent dehydrogenase (short-subunit alcohol dehydrogenase family)
MAFCDLSGKTFLVTGASSGIGQETAIRISRQGGKLIISGRNPKKLNGTLNKLENTGHIALPADLIDEAQMDQLVEKLPELDGLVHSAGIIGPTPAKFIRQENIDRMFRINFEVPVLLNAKLLQKRKIKNNSSIVMLSTIATRFPYFGGTLYTSAKAALEAYTRNLALELAGKSIRVNCLSPGLVNTPLITDPAKEGNPEIMDDSLQRYLKKYPLGVGEASDVANAIIFFLSEESRWISGANLEMGAIVQ